MDHELLLFSSSIPHPFYSSAPFHRTDPQPSLQMTDIAIKAQIANHPLYPNLLSAHIQCTKVGAPQEMALLLRGSCHSTSTCSASKYNRSTTDPELDTFMRSYCEVLLEYKEQLAKPFNEATDFLTTVHSQLLHLCHPSDGGHGGPSNEDMSCGEVEAPVYQESSRSHPQGDGSELKEMLARKYRGNLGSLKTKFLKKGKRGKLSKDARTALLNWWHTHYRWPYPVEEEKNRLSEMTGLDQKQINNWFINQRKRHWRPSEDMRFAPVDGVTTAGSMYFDAVRGTGGVGT